MDPKIIGAFGVLSMCCICSSIVSGVMSGSSEEDPGSGAGAGGAGAGGAAATTPTLPEATYVRVAKTEDITDWNQRYINLHEVSVFDEAGTNVAINKGVIMNDMANTDYVASLPKLVDGDDLTGGHTGGPIHDNSQPQKQWLQINLVNPTNIKSVRLHDRPQYGSRLVGIKVQLLDENQSIMTEYTTPALTLANSEAGLIHSYDFATKTWTHS